jgi:hypothetical protein
MSSPRIPKGARPRTTFAELESYLRDFVTGHYRFLWVVGRVGISKTESVQAATSEHPVLYQKGGQITPLQFFKDCYEHRGHPIILDDAEHLLKNTIGRKLVSALGDTSPARQLSYASTARALGDVPQRFHTTSPLCIISNATADDPAIRSRAITLYFAPSNEEIHRQVATWFWDQPVHTWIGAHIGRLRAIDMRMYIHAHADRKAGRDWARIILELYGLNRLACVVQDLEHDPACPTREDKATRFKEIFADCRGASRATYFRLLDKLQKSGRLEVNNTIGTIPLKRTRPPGVPTELELDSQAAPVEVPSTPTTAPAAPVSPRESFARPVVGQPTPPSGTHRPQVLDDRVGWERGDPEEGDEE